jgi:hypothetical protein
LNVSGIVVELPGGKHVLTEVAVIRCQGGNVSEPVTLTVFSDYV